MARGVLEEVKSAPKEKEVHWKIPDFWSLDTSSIYASRHFKFLDIFWELKIDPSEIDSNDHIALHLYVKEAGAISYNVLSTFSIKKACGSMVGVSSFYHTFCELKSQLIARQFFARSALSECKSELLPSNELVIVCNLKQLADPVKLIGIEKLKTLIHVTFEKFTSDAVNNILHCLVAAGMERFEDLDYVKEEDLKNCLRPIQFRKLIEAYKKAVSEQPSVDDIADSCESSQAHFQQSTSSTTVTPALNELPASTSSNAFTVEDIKISWHRMPAELMENLEAKEIPSPSIRTAMVRIIADDIIRKNKNPTKHLVDLVAAKVATKYPDSLMDKLNDIIIGHSGLTKQIYSRIENEGRKSRKKIKERRSGSQKHEQPIKKQCIAAIDSYGCVMWSPPCPNNVTLESMQDKKQMLVDLVAENPTSSEITKLISETFYLQRLDINSGCTLTDLKKSWPALFIPSGLLQHFQILTNVNLGEELEKNILSRAKDVMMYLKTLTIKNLCEHFWIVEKAKNPDEIIVFLSSIATYFKEDVASLFLASMICSPHHFEGKLGSTPLLIMKGSSIFEAEFYMLACDGRIIIEHLEGSLNAISALFSCFFVFNLKYPDTVKVTLEFFQRCLVGINPDSGSKAERKEKRKLYNGVNPKISSFLQKMSQFHSWTKDVRS